MAEWGLGFDDKNDDPFGGGGASIAMRDMLFASVAAMAALVVILLVSVINTQQQNPTKGEINEPAESLKIEVFWQVQDPKSEDKPYRYKLIDADVDTGVWFRGGPTQQALSPVWFTNMGAGFLNLRRDDLGNRPGIESEYDPVNYELAETRGIPAGEYCVNVHLYRNDSSLEHIPVTVNVRLVHGQRMLANGHLGAPTSSDQPILTRNVSLDHIWQEINVFCFTMDESTKLVPSKTYHSDSMCFHNANTNQCS